MKFIILIFTIATLVGCDKEVVPERKDPVKFPKVVVYTMSGKGKEQVYYNSDTCEIRYTSDISKCKLALDDNGNTLGPYMCRDNTMYYQNGRGSRSYNKLEEYESCEFTLKIIDINTSF